MDVKLFYDGLKTASLPKEVIDEAESVLRTNEGKLQRLLNDFHFKHPDVHEDWRNEIRTRVYSLLNPLFEKKGLSKEVRKLTYDSILSLV